MSQINSFRDLDVYKDAFALQQRIETEHWICTVEACQYEPRAVTDELRESITSIGKRRGRMIEQHDSFCLSVHEPADPSYPTSDRCPPISAP